jgi:predicted metal-dependent hydrolase
MRFDFAGVPRHWFAGNLVATHLANGLNLLFPAGERFFVRSVRHYAERIKDKKLRDDVKGFSAQEGLHAYAHEQFFQALEKQGFDIRAFLSFYERFAYGVVEKAMPAEMCLSVTSACEHFTATMATHALKRFDEGTLASADPTMRALLFWHAVEEIEHRSVAFDVLHEINPSYELRMAGFAIAAACLFGLWIAATGSLVVQEMTKEKLPPSSVVKAFRARAEARKKLGGGRPDFGRAIREYARRDFHPSNDARCDELARKYAASAGL